MNQQKQTGSDNGGQGSAPPPGSPQFTPPEKSGNGDQQSGKEQGQSSSETDPYAKGGESDKETEDLGQYGADGKLKEPAAKKQDGVELKYKIEGLEELSDDEATQIKEFAKNNRLSKEQAQSYVSNLKSISDKNFESQKSQEKLGKEKLTLKKSEEVKKLVAAIGGKDGVEFKQNYTKLGQFLGKHMPEFKKALDGSEFFPPSSVMKELFDLQERLTKEDSLVNGGAAGGKQTTGGGLYGFFNKT